MRSPERSKHFFSHSILLWLGIGFFITAGIVNQHTSIPRIELSKQETALNFNNDLLIFLSAGNKRLITDLLWVQTLLESDLEHHAKRDLSNWMYIRFNTIATLDPNFYENYAWGGQYLSIVKDDLLGAVNLMEKGVRYFPDDYRLMSSLGFAYYFELGNYKEGLKWMEKIQFHPKAPHFFPTIVMKLRAELGYDLNVIMFRIQELMKTTQDERMKEKLRADLYSVKAERDISCLNSGEAGCETKDAYGDPYIKSGDRYYAKHPFIPYRLKRKEDRAVTKPVQTI